MLAGVQASNNQAQCHFAIASTTVKGFRVGRNDLSLFKLYFNKFIYNRYLSFMGKFIYAFEL